MIKYLPIDNMIAFSDIHQSPSRKNSSMHSLYNHAVHAHIQLVTITLI